MGCRPQAWVADRGGRAKGIKGVDVQTVVQESGVGRSDACEFLGDVRQEVAHDGHRRGLQRIRPGSLSGDASVVLLCGSLFGLCDV